MLRSRNRRKLLAASAVLTGVPALALSATTSEREPVRIGTTPVFLDDQLGLLEEWRRYLERSLDRPVRFVQRRSYREITDLLLRGDLEAAWICGYPYVLNRTRVDLCAVPVYRGRPLYQSYLVVPQDDGATRRITDLSGKVFAYSDPQSNSGYLVPYSELVGAGADPNTFFRRTLFTFAHKKVVEAVSVGLAQGGAVDGYIFETMQLQSPSSVARVRVAWRSSYHGFPPIVTRHGLDPDFAERLRRVFWGMKDDADGRTILGKLNIDGFEAAKPELFASIEMLVRQSGVVHA